MVRGLDIPGRHTWRARWPGVGSVPVPHGEAVGQPRHEQVRVAAAQLDGAEEAVLRDAEQVLEVRLLCGRSASNSVLLVDYLSLPGRPAHAVRDCYTQAVTERVYMAWAAVDAQRMPCRTVTIDGSVENCRGSPV